MEQKEFEVEFLGIKYPAFYITEYGEADEAICTLEAQDVLFGLDTETCALPEYSHVDKAALTPLLSTIRLIQIFNGRSVVVLDIRKIQQSMVGSPLEEDSISIIFEEFFTKKRFVGHNALFDLQFFKHCFGITIPNYGCTYILSKLLFHATYPTDEGLSSSLKSMVKMLFKVDVAKEMQASEWGSDDLTYEQVYYAALDAVYTLKVAEKLAPGLSKLKLQKSYDLLKRSQAAIGSIELNGIKLDIERHRKTITVWRDKLYEAKKELLTLTGLTKVTSHTMAEWLQNNLPEETLAIWPVTEKGKLSTDSNTFSEFSYLEVVKPFSNFQRREKLTSSFGMNLIEMVNPKTGRLHADYNLCGARTGRLSCSRPNLQQLPRSPNKKRNPDEPDVRSNFIPEPGCIYVCADYNQIELRVAAELSQDEEMQNAYRKGIDLHALTASQISRKNIADVSDEDRQKAKALNFGLLFGLGARKLSHYAKKSYGVTIEASEATETVRAWRELYSGYAKWQQEQVRLAGESFTCRTPFGKLRKLPSDNTYGTSMNTPVQGGAAEVVLHALCRLNDTFQDSSIKIVNCVHDEILIECLSEYKDMVKDALINCMTYAYLDVFPRGIINKLVKASIGYSWSEAK